MSMERRLSRIGAIGAVGMLVATLLVSLPAAGASAFADQAFADQWQAGEAVTPNFWGPLSTARDGRREDYNSGNRVVQYFDKGRMELTNGAVTNGLLATELLTGRMQLGDTAFTNFPPSTAAMAGDQNTTDEPAPGVPLPTYAVVNSVKQLTQPTASKVGAASTTSLQRFGGSPSTPATYAPSSYPKGADYTDANIARFDDVTQHNVPAAFAAYRDRAGLGTIGYAIIEPFWSPVRVGGVTRQVLIGAFERRVLTYTPDNIPAYQVEMGNVGQHYYQWRYVTNTGGAGMGNGMSTTAPTIPTVSPTVATGAFPVAPIFTRPLMALTQNDPTAGIGNPTADVYTEGGIAVLPFEHGVMLYLPRRSAFYALIATSDRKLVVFPREFDDNNLTTMQAPGPRPGTFVPRLGFGKVWQDNPGLQGQLGYATGDEQRYTDSVQLFERGLLVVNQPTHVVDVLDITRMRWSAIPLT